MRRIWTLAFLLLTTGSVVAEELPILNARFIIQSRKFSLGLNREQSAAENQISDAVAAVGQSKYPFLDWRGQADKPAATLEITLQQQEINSTTTAYFLNYEAFVRGPGRDAIPLRLGSKRPLYAAGKKNKPFNDRVTLEANVVARFEQDLQTFAEELEDSFIRKIALCTQTPKVEGHMIVIDFPWEKLKTAPRSTLTIELTVRKLDTDGIERDFIATGSVRLTDLARSRDARVGGYLGHIRCAYVDTNQWNADIATSLDERRIRKIAVYMQRYYFDPGGGERPTEPDL
jgi:hypothetical protein